MKSLRILLALIALLPCALNLPAGFYLESTVKPFEHFEGDYAKYVVSLQRLRPRRVYFGENHFCAGTIIGPRYVLTASHCVFDYGRRSLIAAKDILIVAGAPNRLWPTNETRLLHVARIIPYAKQRSLQGHDLAVIQLNETIEVNLTRTMAIAQLPEWPLSVTTKRCSMLGWGQSMYRGPYSDILVETYFKLLSMRQCRATFSNTFRNSMLCAQPLPEANKDACRGDSGGPLFCGNKLVGIVSIGVRCDMKYPTIFTDVFNHRRWIISVASGAVGNGKYTWPKLCWVFFLTCFLNEARK